MLSVLTFHCRKATEARGQSVGHATVYRMSKEVWNKYQEKYEINGYLPI